MLLISYLARLIWFVRVRAQYQDALKLISRLSREVRRFDDKLLLVEIHMVESRVHHMLQNVPKSKVCPSDLAPSLTSYSTLARQGALTAARSAANAIYCPPLLQVGATLFRHAVLVLIAWRAWF